MLALHELTLFWLHFSSESEPAGGRIKNWAAHVSAKQALTKTPVIRAPPPSLASRTGIDSSHTAFSAGPKFSNPIQVGIPDLSDKSDHLAYGDDEQSAKKDGKRRLTSTVTVSIERKC
jgi:hypothetical protein